MAVPTTAILLRKKRRRYSVNLLDPVNAGRRVSPDARPVSPASPSPESTAGVYDLRCASSASTPEPRAVMALGSVAMLKSAVEVCGRIPRLSAAVSMARSSRRCRSNFRAVDRGVVARFLSGI